MGSERLEFNATKQKLSQTEENVLFDLTVESADRGFPHTYNGFTCIVVYLGETTSYTVE